MVDKEKFAQEDALGYNLFIHGKNFEVTEPVRLYVWNKLNKIDRFHNHIFHVNVTLEIQRLEHVVDILCHFNHFTVRVEGRSSDMYASIDKAIDRLQQLFRKWKGRIQDYNKKSMRSIDLTVNVYRRPYNDLEDINAQIEEKNANDWTPGKVIATENRPLKMLKLDEAIMKMELSSDPFMIYRDEVDQKLKVIYRREDGDYGIIQAE